MSTHTYKNYLNFDKLKPATPVRQSYDIYRESGQNKHVYKISNLSNISNLTNYNIREQSDRTNSTGKHLLKQYKENVNTNNFDNNYLPHSRKTSANKSHIDSKNNSTMLSKDQSKISSVSAVGQYLDKRHYETQEKINKLRIEKFQREVSNFEFRPKISENSKKILDRIVNEESVMHFRNKEKDNHHPVMIKNVTNSSENRSNFHNTLIPSFKRNNSTSNIKTVQNNNRGKTHEELNDYRKIIEKRENIIVKDEEKVKSNIQQANIYDNNSFAGNIYINRKRPASTNPKQRGDNSIQNNFKSPGSNTEQMTEERRDKNVYKEYDTEKVLESRNKLNNYIIDKYRENTLHPYRENVRNTINYNHNSTNEPKKLFQIDHVGKEISSDPNNTYVNYAKISKHTGSKPQLITRAKEMPLPAEKELIDFNQLDQFSPPNNNSANIIYDIQQNYAKSNNVVYGTNLINKENMTLNKRSETVNSVNSVYSGNATSNNNNDLTNQNHFKNHSNLFNIKKTEVKYSEDSQNKNRKREDLDFFKNYVENIKNINSHNTIDNEIDIKTNQKNSCVMERSNSERKIINNDNHYNNFDSKKVSFTPSRNNNNQQDQFKLDSSSKNYALERLKEMKARTLKEQRDGKGL